MSHFGPAEPNQGITPPEWIPLAQQITTLVNLWSDRDDLTAYVGPGAGRGKAAALFDPYVYEVEVNIDETFGEDVQPGEIDDLTVRGNLFNWPKATGVILHEAMHAKFTTWDLKDAFKALGPECNAAMHTLEEARIEARGVSLYPKNRQFLRASALGLSIDSAKDEGLAEMSSVRAAASLAAYSLARVDAGVLDPGDVKEIRAHLEQILGTKLLNRLQRIWRGYQAVKNPKNEIQKMYKLAQEWEALLQQESEERGEDDKTTQEMLDELIKAMMGDEQSTARALASAVMDQQMAEKWEEELEERNKKDKEQNDNKKKSEEVFKKPAGVGPSNSGELVNKAVKKRKPTGDELAAAIRIGRELDKAKYRDRDKTEFTSATPPGRLRSGAVLQNAAYRSKNMPSSAEPFRRTARKHTDEPTLQIGMMTDISGSMSNAMEPIAVANWVFSEASRRIQAKIASVYYGYKVTPGLAVGQHLSEVVIRDAPDGVHDFDGAFRALDGALNLLNGSGARLLVICSDGNYETHQVASAQKWIKRCEQAGVAVLWLAFARGGEVVRLCKESKAEYHYVSGSPTEASYAIGATAARALTNAGRSR